MVVQGTDPCMIAGTENAPFQWIVDDERILPFDPRGALLPPALVGAENQRGIGEIGMGRETEQVEQLLPVIDPGIGDDPALLMLIPLRRSRKLPLVAGSQGEPGAITQANGVPRRAAMCKRAEHPAKKMLPDRTAIEVNERDDSAHSAGNTVEQGNPVPARMS
jgi:hypothetical protein